MSVTEEYDGNFVGDRTGLGIDCGGGYRTVQAYLTVNFKRMNFTVFIVP